MRESDTPYYRLFEKTSEHLHKITDLASYVPVGLHTVSQYLFSEQSLVAGIGLGVFGFTIAKERLKSRKDPESNPPLLSPSYEWDESPKRSKIALDPDSIVLYDSQGRSDIERVETETQIIFAYPDGSEPTVIELGSRVHPNELNELVVTLYQE